MSGKTASLPGNKKPTRENTLAFDETTRLDLERLRGQLSNERSTFYSHWQELGRFIFPRRTRLYTTDVDKGNRRNQSIIDSTGGLAARALRGGMMSAFTSPSRPWFRLTTVDPDMAKSESVKAWLYDVTWKMSEVFLRSNLYTSLQTVYGDMGVFGTAAMLLQEDAKTVIHTYPFAIGSYYIFADDKLRINGFMREFRLTVRQIVDQFGRDPDDPAKINWDNISENVYTLYQAGTTEAWIECAHAIIPNKQWKVGSPISKFKRYMSTYWERGTVGSQYTVAQSDMTKILQRRGYDKFPVYVPRWEVTGEDIYGTYCPGMEALGDIQQLQMMERRAMQALEKSINPPMVGPSSLRTQKATVLPGDITYLDGQGAQAKFEPAYQINPNFNELEAKEGQIRQRIEKCFYEDLWHIIGNIERGSVTAEEIRALKEEKLQDLGPVVDRLNQDLLDGVVEHTYDIMLKQGMVPPPPTNIQGHALRIEYTSIMAQAQKALGAASIERFWGFATQVRQAEPDNPDVLDKVDVDELFDRYAEAITIPPGIVRDDGAVAAIRKQKQQAQAAQQAATQAEQMSKAAKNLGGTPTDGQNAFTDLQDQANAGNLIPPR